MFESASASQHMSKSSFLHPNTLCNAACQTLPLSLQYMEIVFLLHSYASAVAVWDTKR